MGALLRGTSPLFATLALATLGHAYVVIDDYTEGSVSHTLNGVGSTVDQQSNLDTAHCAFGERNTRFTVTEDFGNLPITFDMGSGHARVSTTPGSHTGMQTGLSFQLGFTDPTVVDLSQEKEFWIDEVATNPNGRFADRWVIYVEDTVGGASENDGWLSRMGGIRFKINGFVGNADFSRLKNLRMDVVFDSDTGPHPQSYEITRFYAVPEPATLWVAGSAMLAFWRRVRRS